MQFKPALYLTALAAHLPLVALYSSTMWNKGHYQFFPLLIAAVVWLVYNRLTAIDSRANKNSGIWPFVWLALDLVLLTFGSLLYASFYAIPALMCLAASYIIDRYGWAGFKAAMPPCLLLLLIIPPPRSYDEKLILKMQFFASQAASWILDALGQIHFREGVILQTATTNFMAEEACSGVRSLFSSLAAIGIFCAIHRYPVWRIGFNLLQTIFWILIGNAIRVALVVFIAENGSDAITGGTNHAMLGLGIFVLIFGLSLSTDRALGVFVEPKEADDSEKTDESLATQTSPANPLLAYGMLALFVLVGLFGARLTYAKNLKFGKFHASNYHLPELKESSLSAEVLVPGNDIGWKQEAFDYKYAGEESIFGSESYFWKYQKGGQGVTISVDGPYSEFHNLSRCYQATGWETTFDHHYPEFENSEDPSELYSSINMSKKRGTQGMVLFTAYDNTGKKVTPRPGSYYFVKFSAIMINNVRLAMGLKNPNSDFADNRYQLPIRQIQFLHEYAGELSEEQTAELKELFLLLRSQLEKSFVN